MSSRDISSACLATIPEPCPRPSQLHSRTKGPIMKAADRPNLKASPLFQKLNVRYEGRVDQFNAVLTAMPHTVYQRKTQQVLRYMPRNTQ